jgi:AbrB family looped-hinge helix DNA binding protein
MPREIIRVRQRNQVTIPKKVSEALAVGEGDLLELVSSGEELVIRPLRLPVKGTPQADEAIRLAERDLDEGRSESFATSGEVLTYLGLRRKGVAKADEQHLVEVALDESHGDPLEAIRRLESARRVLLGRSATGIQR